MKKILKAAIALLLVMVMQVPVTRALSASDLENSDTFAYWKQICSTQNSKYPSECQVYRQFIQDRNDQLEENANQSLEDLENLKLSIADAEAQIAAKQAEIQAIIDEQVAIQADIVEVEASIVRIEAQIETRKLKIVELDNNIKERIVAMEDYSRSNIFLDFILTSQSFSDLITRWDAINSITESDNKLIEALNQEKIELENDIAQAEIQKQTLIDNSAYQETLKTIAENAQTALDRSLQNLLANEKTLAEDIATAERSKQENEDLLDSIGDIIVNPPVSGGWAYPTNSPFYISSEAWSYPEGGWHAGVDLAPPSSIGHTANALAPAAGVVVYSTDRCASTGSFYCGDPTGIGSTYGGNQVYMIVSVNNNIYGVVYKHLVSGSVISPGVVTQGTVVGRIGNSGMSTGTHLHIEVVYLGTNTLDYYVRNWVNGNFGASGSSRLCDNGFGAPCRIAPQTIWGFRMYQWYNT